MPPNLHSTRLYEGARRLRLPVAEKFTIVTNGATPPLRDGEPAARHDVITSTIDGWARDVEVARVGAVCRPGFECVGAPRNAPTRRGSPALPLRTEISLLPTDHLFDVMVKRLPSQLLKLLHIVTTYGRSSPAK